MKKLLVVLVVLTGFAISTYAQTNAYTTANAKSDDVSITAKVIAPITIQTVGPDQSICPVVVKGATRSFTPVVTKPVWGDPFQNQSSGNYGWLFFCTKQAGPESHGTGGIGNNYGLDPYKVKMNFKVHDDGTTYLGLEGKVYFFEKDSQLPIYEYLYTTLGEDFDTWWYADEEQVYMAFYLTKITATNTKLTVGKKQIRVTLSMYYDAI